MKKSLLSLIAAVALIAPGSVLAKGYESVIVTQHDAGTLAVQGTQDMTAFITEEQNLRFETPDAQYIEIPLDNIKSWEYSSQKGDAQWSSISGAQITPDIVITRTDNGLALSNLPDNTAVTLTNLSGITVKSINASGLCEIPYSSLIPGIYLLTFNNQTIKIAVNR